MAVIRLMGVLEAIEHLRPDVGGTSLLCLHAALGNRFDAKQQMFRTT